jgi:glycosyltransferase involved in cell wall biosynthesis
LTVNMPTISVVVPLYNHEKYIHSTIESILDQELVPCEIIVVDDGSTDGSGRIMAEILQRHPDIVFWSQSNQGAYQAINAGIHRATGDIVAILNSDDCYHPQRLNRCAQILADSPEITAVTTALDFMDAKGKKIKNRWYERNRSFFDKEGDLPLALMNGNFFMTTSNIFVRRSVFQDIGYFAPLRYVHDLDFFLRLLVYGKNIHIIDDPLLSYRMHAKNTILEEHINVRAEWAFACARFIVTAQKLPEWREKGWAYCERFNRIMEEHSLTGLLNLFLVFFARQLSTGGDIERFDRDPAFVKLIHQKSR